TELVIGQALMTEEEWIYSKKVLAWKAFIGDLAKRPTVFAFQAAGRTTGAQGNAGRNIRKSRGQKPQGRNPQGTLCHTGRGKVPRQ
ncbi:MAG: hypothetical protein SNJ56_06940, partial [Termitinemataceae bacterium]